MSILNPGMPSAWFGGCGCPDRAPQLQAGDQLPGSYYVPGEPSRTQGLVASPSRAHFGASDASASSASGNGEQGAGGGETGAPLAPALLIGGIATVFGLLVLKDMLTPDPYTGGRDADILARISAEKAARDASFSKAAYHSQMMKSLDRVGAQKARLASWKASRG
jgi:hypothetical protein